MKLTDGSAMVTGASGLGLATASLLLAQGVPVVLTDVNEDALAAAADTIDDDRLQVLAADIRDPESVRPVLDAAESVGPLRYLVHCAGRGSSRVRLVPKDGDITDISDFRDVLETNLVGTYIVLRMAAERMRANDPVDGDRGACVLTASVAAFDGQIGQASYTAAKAGVHGITLVAARDLASAGIRVNTIAPGVMDTPMLARLREDIRSSLAASVPHPRRLGRPEEYAHMAVALLTNTYVNGETVRLDGSIRMTPR